jgi:hypothetical protein
MSGSPPFRDGTRWRRPGWTAGFFAAGTRYPKLGSASFSRSGRRFGEAEVAFLSRLTFEMSFCCMGLRRFLNSDLSRLAFSSPFDFISLRTMRKRCDVDWEAGNSKCHLRDAKLELGYSIRT